MEPLRAESLSFRTQAYTPANRCPGCSSAIWGMVAVASTP
jgi:hypothetical protein